MSRAPIQRLLPAFSLAILAVIAAGGVARAGGETSPAELDRRLLEAELALERSLRAAADVDSLLPVPDLDDARVESPPEPPRVDGDLSDPIWRAATLFRWQTPGSSRFLLSDPWTLHAVIRDGALFLAGERSTPAGEGDLLLLRFGPGECIQLRLGPGRESSALVESRTSARPLDDAVGRFAARTGDGGEGGVAWELRVELDNPAVPLPLGPLRPLRLAASRGDPGELRVSPPFHLVAAPLALRVEELEYSEGRASARVTLVEHGGREELVRLPDLRTTTLPAWSSTTIALAGQAPLGSAGVTWPVRVGSHGLRVGVAIGTAGLAELGRPIDAALELAAANASRAGLDVATVEAEAREIRELAPRAPREAWFRARVLRRRTFLAPILREIDEVLLVKRFHDRRGPFYTTHLESASGGGLSVWSMRTGTVRELLALEETASVRDADLSHDGRRVVFALRRNGGAWDLWTVGIDGDEPRRITDGSGDDIQPCFLPDGRIVFTSTRAGSTNPSSPVGNLSLHVVSLDGTGLRRLGHNYLVDFTPTVLRDGRIAFFRWALDDRPGNFVNALWTIYPDGRELEGLFGLTRAGMAVRPRAASGSDRVACIDAGQFGRWRSPLAGDIAVFDTRVAGGDRTLYRIDAGPGGFADARPLEGDVLLASWGSVETRWAIYLVDRHGNRELLHRDPSISCFDPIPVGARPRPHLLPRLASDDPSAPATLFVRDVYLGLPGVERGSVTGIRVVAVPDRPPGSQWPFHDQRTPVSILQRMVRRDLGTAPVEPDGSAMFDVPSNVSLFLQALDANGHVVRSMRDTVSFAEGEQRSCVGCHEPRGTAPPATAAIPAASLRGPARLRPPSGAASIDFARDIQPILDRACVPCHDAAEPAGGVALSGDVTPYFNLAYETLTRGGNNDNDQYWGEVSPRRAPLVEAIRHGVPEVAPYATGARASRLAALFEEEHHGLRLDDASRREIIRWIDLNVPYYGDWESARLDGDRRVLSPRFESVFDEIFRARCRGCHVPPDLFRGAAINLSRPELSAVLRAPLPRSRGGTGRCRKPVFRNQEDAAHRALLEVLLEDRARLAAAGSSPGSRSR